MPVRRIILRVVIATAVLVALPQAAPAQDPALAGELVVFNAGSLGLPFREPAARRSSRPTPA